MYPAQLYTEGGIPWLASSSQVSRGSFNEHIELLAFPVPGCGPRLSVRSVSTTPLSHQLITPPPSQHWTVSSVALSKLSHVFR